MKLRHMGSRPLPRKPEGLLLLLFKLPVHMYRLGLGPLLGKRFLLLIHEGRRSGKLRQTVLEVIRYDPNTQESLVISAYGSTADWYRNIRTKPPIRIRTGRSSYVPEQRFLTRRERYEAFVEYERRSGRYLRKLLKLMGIEYDGSEEMRREMVSFMRMVAFRPSQPTASGP
jgi:deazaflavin-dependent oxidoreductase (nitroreductase family)